jgi:hypothetical protein
MSTRSLVVGAALAAAMLMATSVGASANLVFCMSDPPVQVVTAGGHYLTVNNMVYLPAGSEQVMNDVGDTASSAPDGRGGTLVTVNVFVPVQAHVVSSVNRFGVSAAANGVEVVTLHLDVPIT